MLVEHQTGSFQRKEILERSYIPEDLFETIIFLTQRLILKRAFPSGVPRAVIAISDGSDPTGIGYPPKPYHHLHTLLRPNIPVIANKCLGDADDPVIRLIAPGLANF